MMRPIRVPGSRGRPQIFPGEDLKNVTVLIPARWVNKLHELNFNVSEVCRDACWQMLAGGGDETLLAAAVAKKEAGAREEAEIRAKMHARSEQEAKERLLQDEAKAIHDEYAEVKELHPREWGESFRRAAERPGWKSLSSTEQERVILKDFFSGKMGKHEIRRIVEKMLKELREGRVGFNNLSEEEQQECAKQEAIERLTARGLLTMTVEAKKERGD